MSETTHENETTILAIQIHKNLRERIKLAASREHRTESSFARFYLEKAAEESEAVENGKLATVEGDQ